MLTIGSMVRMMSANSLLGSFIGPAIAPNCYVGRPLVDVWGREDPTPLPIVRVRRSRARTEAVSEQVPILTHDQRGGRACFSMARNVSRDAEADPQWRVTLRTVEPQTPGAKYSDMRELPVCYPGRDISPFWITNQLVEFASADGDGLPALAPS